MIINGVAYTVHIAAGDSAVVLVPSGTTSPARMGPFVLVDDDDYNSNNDGNADEGEDVNALNDTFSWIQQSDDPTKNRFAPAYIMPIRDGGGPPNNSYEQSNILFDLNIPRNLPSSEGFFNQNSETHENDAFWVVYILVAYQGQNDGDNDPNFESFKEGGLTWAIAADSVSSIAEVAELGAKGSLVFIETMRDTDALTNTNPPYDFRKRAVPHEIGHQMGLAGDKGPEWGLMSDRGTPVFVPLHLNILRWRVHSPTLP